MPILSIHQLKKKIRASERVIKTQKANFRKNFKQLHGHIASPFTLAASFASGFLVTTLFLRRRDISDKAKVIVTEAKVAKSGLLQKIRGEQLLATLAEGFALGISALRLGKTFRRHR